MGPALHGSTLNDTQLGLSANWRQFALLILVNAFVGAMVGLERTVVPLLAEAEFGIASLTATVGFIASFGIAKATTNLLAGILADRFGRKTILLAGWLVAIPVPLLLIWAPTWGWVVAANLLLGVNQGLSWSATLIMKIDLVGPRQRGLAMGLNEASGYLAVAVMAYATGVVAERFGLRPEPFYLGIAVVALGLAISLLWVRETQGHAQAELSEQSTPEFDSQTPKTSQVLIDGSWRHPALATASQTGLVNNLIDGMAWGVFPLVFARRGLALSSIATLVAIYPAVWGLTQLLTGAWSDKVGRKWLIVSGMLLQGLALVALAAGDRFAVWAMASALLGLGTAMVYPTLLAAVGDVAPVAARGTAVGVYRFWRDGGYLFGALMVGGFAGPIGLTGLLWLTAALAVAMAVLVAVRMPETMNRWRPTAQK